MNYNTPKNDGYGVKPPKPASQPRSAYEIRTDLLKLSFEMHVFNKQNGGGIISADDIIATAASFNEFISKRNDF